MSKKKIILISVVALFILIQLVPVDRSNGNVSHKINWDSPETEANFQKACADCHSNETKWPFYSYIAPVSWLVSSDVKEGREKFNISTGNLDEADEAAELVEKGAMPMPVYLIMHGDAKLKDNDTRDFVNGLKATFGTKSGTNGIETEKE